MEKGIEGCGLKNEKWEAFTIQKEHLSFRVRCYTLEESQCITNPITRNSTKFWWRKSGV